MIAIKYVILLVSTIIFCNSIQAQHHANNDFDFLVNKIKCDYPGYKDKVKQDLVGLENSLRAKIDEYPDSAFYYFNQYTSYFKDGHLRIGRLFYRDDNMPSQRDISSFRKIVTIDDLAQTQRSSTINGVWTSLHGDIVIMNNPDDPNILLGVSIDFRDFDRGNVVYEFTPINDTIFNVVMHTMYDGEMPTRSNASLEFDRQIIEIHDWNIYFTRKSNSECYDHAFLYTYHPKHPNGRNIYPIAQVLNDSTFYIRIVSFQDAKEYINKLVNKHLNDITTRPNLILDIRMNNGGQSDAYEALTPFMYTTPFKIKGVEWYASKGNIAQMEEGIKNNDVRDGEEGLKWLQTLVDEMKTNIGGYVVHPYYQGETLVSMDTIYRYPKNIGIIIEKSNASAAEQFLLFAKNSRKVTLFGNESTAGILDYSNVTPNDFPSGKYELYCPMSRSLRLPENSIDNIGIAPDVYIPFPSTKDLYDRLDNWVYFVMYYLEEMNNL